MSFQRALGTADLWPGEMRGVVVDGTKVLLVNIDGRVAAYADRCAHQAVLLSQGRLAECILTCRAHEWQYDVRTGKGVNPLGARLMPYPVKVEADQILVDVAARPDEPDLVGPVVQSGPASDALVAALLEENPEARIVDRGSYLRVLAPRLCRVSRAAVERHGQLPFRLPADLEAVMYSFKGRLTITPDDATWELAERPPGGTP